MSKTIFDLAAASEFTGSDRDLVHPAGVTLPFDGARHGDIITPRIRKDICDGTYAADLIDLLPEALVPGDRVLVIGAGLGVVSTLIAKSGMAERIIAVEPNAELIPYLARVFRMNGVPEVEAVHGVLAHGRVGQVPFFIDRDFRHSSLLPRPDSGRHTIMVPLIDMDLILAEEEISLIVSDVEDIPTELFTRADLGNVNRILMRLTEERLDCWDDGGLCVSLAASGYKSAPRPGNRPTTVFRRVSARDG